MSRHYKPRKVDVVIDYAYWLVGSLQVIWNSLRKGVDRRTRSVVTYFQTTRKRTIITNFLAYVAVIGIILIPVASGIFWIAATFFN